MSSPVGGSGNPNQPPPNDNRGSSEFINRIRLAIRGIFNREPRASRLIPSPAIPLTDEQILANWVQSYSEENFPCRSLIDNRREQAQALVNWSNRYSGQSRRFLDFTGRMTFGLNELPTALFRGYQNIGGDDYYPQTLPDLPDIQRVSLRNCENLRSVGNLNGCVRLELTNCPHLQNLPSLPNCSRLVLRDCPLLQSIPNVAEGCQIDISNCPLLPPRPNPARAAELPAIPLTNDQILENWVQSHSEEYFPCRMGYENRRAQAQALVYFCNRYRIMRLLNLGGRMTYGLNELPIALFQGYQHIKGDHYHPQTLPDLPNIRQVSLQNCENLRSVGNLVNCAHFELTNCPHLQNLPSLPNCRYLVLRDCPLLQSIPNVPDGCDIVISNCPLLPPRPNPARAAELPRPSRPIPSSANQLTNDQILANWVQSYSEENFPCRPSIDSRREQAQALVNWSRRQSNIVSRQWDLGGRMTFGLNELPIALFQGYQTIQGNHYYPQTLPDLSNIRRVSLQNCENLRSVGNFVNCEHFELANCPYLQNLPPLPNCTRLVLRDCPLLRSIPNVPVGCEIVINNCPLLPPRPNPALAAELPRPSRPIPSSANQLTNDQILANWVQSYSEEYFPCTQIIDNRREQAQALVNWSRQRGNIVSRRWDLGGRMTFGLNELPIALFQGYRTIQGNHYYPQTLPDLSNIQHVILQNCENLRSVGNLVNCAHFELANCPVLENLPPLPSCRRLVLANCPQLRSIPEVPEGCEIDISNCPFLPPRPNPALAAQLPRQQAPPQLAQPVIPSPNIYQGQINRAAGGTLQGALDSWSRFLPEGQEQLPRAEALKFDDNTRARDQRLFQIFLNRLQETADFRQASPQNRQNFALRVATIVRDMVASEEFLQKAIWALDSANDACGDRVATGIESLEILSLIHGQNKPQTDVDTACLAIRLDRLDQVRKKAIALNPDSEGLETVLFLQLKLKDRLQLPLQTGRMLYEGVGQVSDEAVESTAQEILAATSTDGQVYEILVDSEVWTDFLQREYDVFYGEVLEGLEIIANSAEGTDYPANLAALEKKPTSEWKRFLDNVGPSNASPEDRGALQREVLQALREACPSLTGKDYNTAYNQLIQQIHKKKTIEWLRANRDALRAKLNP